MVYELPIQAIDYPLYNYLYLRKEVDLLGTNQGGMARIPPRGGKRSSPVEVIRHRTRRADLRPGRGGPRLAVPYS